MRNSYQSEFTARDISIGKRFDFLERKWEIIVVNQSNFVAKTTDNDSTKRQKIADFIFKKENK